MIERATALNQTLRSAGVSLCRISRSGAEPGDIRIDEGLAERLGVPAWCRFADIVRRCERTSRGNLARLARALRTLDAQPTAELQLHGADGTALWLRIVALGDGGMLALLDVSDEQRTIALLRESEEHWRRIVEFNPLRPWIADASGKVIEVTHRWADDPALSHASTGDDGWMSKCHPDDISIVKQNIIGSMAQERAFDTRGRILVSGEYRWMRAVGHPRRDQRGRITHWYGYTEDVHEHIQVLEQTRWNAEHDALTGLTNRAHFTVRLEHALAGSLQILARVGVLLIDLDHFKEVNDLLGHHTGDDLLVSYTAQLTAALPPDAIAARFGGDEFAVMLPGIDDAQALLDCAKRILAIRQTVDGPGGHIDCRASIGAAMYPDHGRNPSELMRHADIALYAAKGSGRAKSLIFEPQMQHEVRERAAMVSRARTAAFEGDVLAYYQPKVSLETGALAGFEALLRWRDSCGTIQSPAAIVAAFEDPEVADLLGKAMLAHVIADVKAWTRAGLAFGAVAINAAPAELRRVGFAPRLIEAVREAGLPPRAIEVEVTEGVFLGRGADEAKRAIHQLHEAGVPLSLDDFGTGFASLSHLRALPIDAIKIDRSFIAHIAEANGDKAIVSAIVTLGHNLGMKVIAEGIETPAQAEALRAFGCKYAQGYYFGTPTPAAGIPHLIRGWGGSEDDAIFGDRRMRSLF